MTYKQWCVVSKCGCDVILSAYCVIHAVGVISYVLRVWCHQSSVFFSDCTKFIYFLVKILYTNIWWCNFVLIFSISTYFAVIDAILESYAVSIRDSQIQDRWLQGWPLHFNVMFDLWKIFQHLEGNQCGDLLKTGNRTSIWPSNPTSGHTHQGYQIWKRHVHPNVHHSAVCHSEDMEAT